MGNCKPPFSGYGCPVRVKSGNAHNEPMKSAFHPIATEQRTQLYVGSVPKGDIATLATLGKGLAYLLLVPVPVGFHAAEGLE
jgi:hypothetical protein